MDKKIILKAFVDQIENDLAVLTRAAIAAREDAIHSENKAEDQYDTRGLEASYLAGAQSKRAAELEELLKLYQYVDMKNFTSSTPIAATALVELETSGKQVFNFLMPKGGGMTAKIDGKNIHVITPVSPLGEALVGQVVGGDLEVRIQGTSREYTIINVW